MTKGRRHAMRMSEVKVDGTAKKATKANARRKTEETYEWLTARGRSGTRRIERLSWTRLARICNANRPNSPIRKAINAEARRLGYAPRVILGIHA